MYERTDFLKEKWSFVEDQQLKFDAKEWIKISKKKEEKKNEINENGYMKWWDMNCQSIFYFF